MQKLTYKLVISILSIFFYSYSSAQTVCSSVNITAKEDPAVDFVFDNLKDYLSGKTKNNVITLRVDVEDLAGPPANCKWKLIAVVDNEAQVDNSTWVNDVIYGNNPNPTLAQIDIISIKIRNGCNTPINSDYYNFELDGDEFEIIKDLTVNNPSSPCTSGVIVNGAGDYKQYYDQYIFKISFKIVPTLNNAPYPGVYHINFNFKLIEDI